MKTALLICMIFQFLQSNSQNELSDVGKINNFPDKLFKNVETQSREISNNLESRTKRYLRKLSRKEDKLKRQLNTSDSSQLNALFNINTRPPYDDLLKKLKDQNTNDISSMGSEYLPYADSLKTMLSFLDKNTESLKNGKILPGEIQSSLTAVKELQGKLQVADEIKKIIQARSNEIRQYISGASNSSAKIGGLYKDYTKQLYYYQAQIRAYRETLNDPDKLLKEALVLLNKIPAFAQFMKQNSMLGGLFNISPNYGSAEAVIGLQTREQVMGMIQTQIGQKISNPQNFLQNSLQGGEKNLGQMKDKLEKLGGGSEDMAIPNFRPNTEKTKTFFKRLEYGINLQTQHAAYYFPSTTDIGFSVGYKLPGKNIIGVGGSYKFGWGKDFKHVQMTNQGASVRSFIDIKAKKSIYISGGFEYNYQPLMIESYNLSSWQQSGLLGISKIISLKTKLYKKTKIQLLWDFLSYRQVPRGQPFKFRIGYIF